MGDFAGSVFAYPTAVYSVLLGVILFYWALAMIGLVDFESGPEFDLDGELPDVGTLASYLMAFGLGGVPLSVVVSLLVLYSWTVCSLGAIWILPWVPTSLLGAVAGTVLLIGSFLIALPAAAVTIRPLRKLFVTHQAVSNASLVGQQCRILTRLVDESFGRAEVPGRGAGYNIRIYAETPNTLTRGAQALVVEYDAGRERYRVQALDAV